MKNLLTRFLTTERLAVMVPRNLAFFALCVYSAFLLRFSFHIPELVQDSFWLTIPAIVLIKSLVSLVTGEWKVSPKNAGVREMHIVFLSATISALVIFVANPTVFSAFGSEVPRSVIALDFVLSIGFAGLFRILFAEPRNPEAQPASWLPMSALLSGIILLAVAFIYCSLTHDPNLQAWFNADALYPGHLVEDVFVEGNGLDGWMFPPAPFLVPDVPCAMVGRLLTSKPALGMFFTGALLFLLVTMAAVYAAAVSLRDKKAAVVFMTIAAALVAVAIARGGTGNILRFLLLPAYHTGTYALALLLAALGVQIAANDGASRRVLIGLFALVGFCAGFSDLMTIAYVSAPLTAALAVGWLLKLTPPRRTAVVVGLIWSMPLAGVVVCRETIRMLPFSTYSQISISSMFKATRIVLEGFWLELQVRNLLAVAGAVWILASWVWIAGWLYRRWRDRSLAESMPVAARRRFLLILCFSLAGFSSAGALIAGGNYTLLNDGYAQIPRYLHPLYFTPLFFWPMLLPEPWLTRFRLAFPRVIAAEYGLAAAGILFAATAAVGIGPFPLNTYAPDYVRKLEQIASERGLRHGVSYYWTARHVNMFAQGDLKIIPVTPQMIYCDWMNNRNWVTVDDLALAPRPEFVVVSPTELYQKGDIYKHFGLPAEEIPLDSTGACSVLIYNRSKDVVLRNLFVTPTAIWLKGFYPLETVAATNRRWCEPEGVLVVHNPTSEILQVAIQFDCATGHSEPSNVTITGPLFKADLSVSQAGQTIAKRLAIPPGSHAVLFETDAKLLERPGDPRKLAFQVRNFQMSLISGSENPVLENFDRIASQTRK